MKKFVVSLLIAGLSIIYTPQSQAADVSQYVQFVTPITTQLIELPTSGNKTEIEYLVKLMNPTKDVSTIDFELYDSSGEKIDSDFEWFWDEPSKLVKKTLRIYNWSFTPIKLPLTLKTKIKFNDSAAKFSIDQSFILNVIPNQAEAKAKAEAEAKAIAEAAAQAKAKADAEAKYNAEMAAAKLKIINSLNKMYVGKPCTKAGSTKTVMSLVKYTCIKSGNKLIWNKGIVVG